MSWILAQKIITEEHMTTAPSSTDLSASLQTNPLVQIIFLSNDNDWLKKTKGLWLLYTKNNQTQSIKLNPNQARLLDQIEEMALSLDQHIQLLLEENKTTTAAELKHDLDFLLKEQIVRT